jgi:hypothetical protein
LSYLLKSHTISPRIAFFIKYFLDALISGSDLNDSDLTYSYVLELSDTHYKAIVYDILDNMKKCNYKE